MESDEYEVHFFRLPNVFSNPVGAPETEVELKLESLCPSGSANCSALDVYSLSKFDPINQQAHSEYENPGNNVRRQHQIECCDDCRKKHGKDRKDGKDAIVHFWSGMD